MKWVWTKRWLFPPKSRMYFRVEDRVFICKFTFWHWALIKEVEVTWK